MKYIISIVILSLLIFCNSSEITKNIPSEKKQQQENYELYSKVDERFKEFEEFEYDSLGSLKTYKFHKLSNYDSLLCGVKYSNGKMIEPISRNYKLVLAREHFDNGDVIFYLVSPPLMLMETFVTYEDKNDNEVKGDTLYGSTIKVNLKDVHKVYLEVGAVDTISNKLMLENFGFKLDTFINSGVIYR